MKLKKVLTYFFIGVIPSILFFRFYLLNSIFTEIKEQGIIKTYSYDKLLFIILFTVFLTCLLILAIILGYLVLLLKNKLNKN